MMKRTFLLGLLIFSLTARAQDFYSSGDCKASFKFDVNYEIMTYAPATVLNFYDTSEGKVKDWYWDFGDGSGYINEQNPIHIFNHPLGGPTVKMSPYRTVTLTIVTDSCKSTFSQTINIMDIGDSIKQSCMAHFKHYKTVSDIETDMITVNFVNGSEGNDLKYYWQFGDGTTSNEREPVKKLSINEPVYKVCLTVTGNDSCSAVFCDDVFVVPPVIIDTFPVDTTQPDCFAAFGYNKKDLLMGPLPSSVIEFYSKVYPEPAEWYWDFGDGSTSNEPNPTHVYIQQVTLDSMFGDTIVPKPYPFRTVTLTVITADKCKTSYSETIQVFGFGPGSDPEPEKCMVYFKYDKPDDMVSIPEVVPVRLIDVSPGEVLSRLWKFEDGTFNTEKEPIVSFNIFQPVHKVCLTVTFANGCVNTFCDAVYLNDGFIDTSLVVDPVSPYYIKVDGGFPVEFSSCAGWASVKVYLGDSLITPEFISWSTGDTLPEVNRLCPFQTYTVKALMPDGTVVWTDFVLSTDGSVTPNSPINWWLSGDRGKTFVQSDAAPGMKVEWRLCDGTIVEADSIQLDAINCGGNESNLIVKDAMGNVMYSESISLKGSFTGIDDISAIPQVKLWPNPVTSKLNIHYSGGFQTEVNIEICDIMGKMVSTEKYFNVSDGYEFSINTESLKQGIYICRISGDGKVFKAQKFSRR